MEATGDEILAWLQGLHDSDLLIIVEGKKDAKALAGLGLKRVVHLDGPLFRFVEAIADVEKKVVILTDLDKKGKQLYGKLKKDLVAHGVQVDRTFREFLQRKTKVSHIEGLDTYIRNMEGEDA